MHEFQYGFRRGRSTIDALRKTMEAASHINSGAYGRRTC